MESADVMMPKMNGYDVCKKIGDKENLGIVMLTAKNDLARGFSSLAILYLYICFK